MKRELLETLACPNCKQNLFRLQIYKSREDDILEGEINCKNCSDLFPIVDSIPIMLPKYLRQENHNNIEDELIQKKMQMAYFDERGNSDLEINRPHRLGALYSFLIEYKLNASIKLLGHSLKGANVLNICCGSGMEAEFLSLQGAKVVGVDISIGAIKGAKKRAQIYGFDLDLVVADAENLPFISGCFDYSFTHDGLHHLPEPKRGILELSRVANKGIFFTEPASALLTRLACFLGVAKKYEPSGNRVYRFKERELKSLIERLGFKRILLRRYLMFYSHNPAKKFSIFDFRFMMSIFKIFFYSINALIGQWGNKLTLIAQR